MARILALTLEDGWCFANRAREVAARLPEHQIDVHASDGADIEGLAGVDLVWLLGAPHLYSPRLLRGMGEIPLAWTLSTGGSVAMSHIRRNRWAVKAAAAVIVQNQGAVEVLGAARRERGVHLLPNGVDTQRFSPGGAGEGGSRWVVGMAANLGGWRWASKGANTVFTAAGWNRWFRLEIACKDAARLLEARPDLRDPNLANVREVPPDAMPDWYRGLWVYVQPSRAEGCSNSIWEAMASGLPTVICGESGWHGETCRDGLTDHPAGEAVIVPYGDPKALSVALGQLCNDPAAAARIGRNARAFAERHTWDVAAEGYRQAFAEALERPGAARRRPTRHRAVEAQPRAAFDLVTVATSSYIECLRVTLPTWQRAGAERVTVISDGVKPEWVPDWVTWHWDCALRSTTWIEGVMARAECLARWLTTGEVEHCCIVLDADCMVLERLDALAEMEADIGLARFEWDPRKTRACYRGTANIGVLVLRRPQNAQTCAWLRCWVILQKAYLRNGHGDIEGTIAADQYAATDLARGRACGVTVQALDERRWNSSHTGDRAAWLREIERDRPAIVHLKGGLWADPSVVCAVYALSQQGRTPRRRTRRGAR